MNRHRSLGLYLDADDAQPSSGSATAFSIPGLTILGSPRTIRFSVQALRSTEPTLNLSYSENSDDPPTIRRALEVDRVNDSSDPDHPTCLESQHGRS